ncbi:MAG: GGDEF domain-containing protein [Pleomorphochaeta sp.]
MVFELIVIVSYCFFIITFLRNSNYSIKKSSSDLFALINKDELTQLYNRHYLSNVLEKSNKKFSFALADIDNFKQINDIYGHSTGDFVLKEVSRIFKKYKNEKLTIVRFGGDEFLFIFECDNEKEIIRLMEKIRKEIEEKDFGQDLRSDKVSISCGVTKCSIVNSWNETFEKVDKALYKAKEEGRNRVCFIN